MRERFTYSEVILMGWRSQEQSYNFEQRRGEITEGDSDAPSFERRRKEYGIDDQIPTGLPERFFDENGEVNLSKVTGRDALKYMASQGIHIPMRGGLPPTRGHNGGRHN